MLLNYLFVPYIYYGCVGGKNDEYKFNKNQLAPFTYHVIVELINQTYKNICHYLRKNNVNYKKKIKKNTEK